jgi:ATP/maltotriose-dependent transcriptional regulator MalT/DNA-binding SARP family transcriptional activator
LLCAPAGYGKTTLLVDTTLQISAACCWYFFEDSDTPAILLNGLCASIQRCFPELHGHLDAFYAQLYTEKEEHIDSARHWEHTLNLLVAVCNSTIAQQFVLVLSNYHKIRPENRIINRLISHLLAHCFQRGVIIIESRSLPDLNLAPLIARRQMFGLGSNKLCFSAQEVYELAHLQGFTTFSLQESEHLTASFEGWIAGILLGSGLGYTQLHPLAPSYKKNWGALAQVADRQQLSIYVTNEVFGQETATLEFLQSVSIFDQLTPERCNALLGITDAAERLIYAERRGLFIMRGEKSVDEDRVGVYICHPILRELFREHVRSQSLARYQELHRSAAYLLQNDREYELALLHSLLAQEYSLAISIISQVTPGFITQGQNRVVDLWLDTLPEQNLMQDPWLLMVLVNIHLTRNEYAQVPLLLDAIETLLAATSSGQDPPTSQLLSAEYRLARSKLLFYQGNFQDSEALCQEALETLPVDKVYLRIKTHHRLGVCLVVGMGRIHEGIMQFQLALQLSYAQNAEQQTATLHRLLASAYAWSGSYTLAGYHQERALRIWERLHEPRGMINNLTSMGLLRLRQGLTRDAEELLMKALQLAREVNRFKSGEAYALVALGELSCAQAQYVRALAYLEDGLNLAKQCGDLYLIHCSLCSIATSYLFIGEIRTSRFFLDQIVLQKQEEQSYEGLLRCLIQGRLSMALQTYVQAQQDLEYAVALGEFTNIRFLHMQALLMLAVCFARQQKTNDALQMTREALELNEKGNLDYTLEVESRCYPELSALLTRVGHTHLTEHTGASLPDGSPRRQTEPLASGQSEGVMQQEVVPQLRVQAFGEPKVYINDIPVTRWHMLRSLELFFLLLDSDQPLPKDRLIEALWPANTANEQIDTTMRTAIYYLRQALGKTAIVYAAGLYRLNLSALYGPEIWYDVVLFEKRYNEARKALDEHNDAAARSCLAGLVALYKGDYLQSFYNDWCIRRRNRLRLLYMDGREQLALLAWREETWDESIEHWQYLLSVDPCFEKAHYGIMRCYLRQGKRELALRQYQSCCQNLQAELQTTPGQAIKKLYQQIKQT